jgi:hypothetical protein
MRLAKIFKKDYNRLDPDNHVPVLIPRSIITEETLTCLRVKTSNYPLFNPNNVLPFLKGRHRIKVAYKVFLIEDKR